MLKNEQTSLPVPLPLSPGLVEFSGPKQSHPLLGYLRRAVQRSVMSDSQFTAGRSKVGVWLWSSVLEKETKKQTRPTHLKTSLRNVWKKWEKYLFNCSMVTHALTCILRSPDAKTNNNSGVFFVVFFVQVQIVSRFDFRILEPSRRPSPRPRAQPAAAEADTWRRRRGIGFISIQLQKAFFKRVGGGNKKHGLQQAVGLCLRVCTRSINNEFGTKSDSVAINWREQWSNGLS